MPAKKTRGRPSKYRPEYVDEVNAYLATTGGPTMTLPTVEGFAIMLGVSTRALYRWSKKHKEFRRTLGRIKQYQKVQLINDGIYGGKEVNSTIVKLLLQNNHGMKERSDITSKDDKLDSLIVVKDGDKTI